MEKFSRRIYKPKLFFGDMAYVVTNFFKILKVVRGGVIPRSTIEKVMLATTAVNGCTHCARFHTILARNSGVGDEEINDLLSQDIDREVDENEVVALGFAQHYAETERNPDAKAVENLHSFYGEDGAEEILLYIRLILIGNLAGNTFDAFLSRLKGNKAENSSFLFEFFVTAFGFPAIVAGALYSKWHDIKA